MDIQAKEPRKKNLNIRLTIGELKAIAERANKDRRAVSEWARLQLLRVSRGEGRAR